MIVAGDWPKTPELRELLVRAGYRVEEAGSSEAAMERCPKFEPDLVLIEAGLAARNGFAVCHALKLGPGEDAIPLVFISAQNGSQHVVAALAAGAVDCLSDAISGQELLARIRVHLLNRLRLAQLHYDDKAKNRLLCMAAHDLRNPLVSIRALTHMLRAGAAGEVAPKQRDLLDTVYDASQSMLDLVNELLDVSVLEAGELQLTVSPTSLAELVTASVRLCSATAAEKGSIISWQPGPLPPLLALDKPKVRQVLNNLLSNALKFSPPGSTITFATGLTASHCSIAVRDQGPGIRECERAKLFKNFSRTSVKPTGGESSTGLGLAICHKIMQAHAGSICASNVPGGGAEFCITFPLHP